MRVTILDETGRVVNIIEATSLEVAQQFYPYCRVATDTDTIEPANPDPDAELRAQYEAEKAAKEQAEFEQFKARSGAPTYKAASVHIAAEKLGVLTAIETAIDALISQAGDKSLLIWWEQTDTISRGDAEWQQIEPLVEWEKLGVTPEELFDLAAQV